MLWQCCIQITVGLQVYKLLHKKYLKKIGRIHKNEQLLNWPFARILLESLYIKTSNYVQVKDHGLWTEQLLIPSL